MPEASEVKKWRWEGWNDYSKGISRKGMKTVKGTPLSHEIVTIEKLLNYENCSKAMILPFE